jgi:signal transduction histidine kinase
LEAFWREEMRREFKRFEDRVTFTWYNELSFDEMLKRVATLPPHSAIFWELLIVDAAGGVYEGDTALTRLHAVANAPIFSFDDAFFGRELVGGPMHSDREYSQQTAAVAVRVLGGEKPGDIKTSPVGFAAPKFDWRELQRWGIAESRLPLGSEIYFREPSAWDRYRAQILTVSAIVLLQSALIIWLLYEHRRRRNSEAAARELSGRLINSHEEERSRLARELHDDVTQRLALLAIEAGREQRGSPAIGDGDARRTLREGLVKLSGDVHALSYRLHPSILEDLGLADALRAECDTFSQRETIPIDIKISDPPEELPRDVSLNLFRVAQEALRNIGRHASAKSVEVSLRRVNGGLELAVHDDGAGFDFAYRDGHPRLGHASMRERIRLVGGEIDIDSTLGQGTTVVAWVPLKDERR